METTPSDLPAHARQMRHEPTDAEKKLWQAIRNQALGVKFRRQVPTGRYILDFACISHKLVIELAGHQHAVSNYDRRRASWLRHRGFRVLRFANDDVLEEFPGLLFIIAQALTEASETTRT